MHDSGATIQEATRRIGRMTPDDFVTEYQNPLLAADPLDKWLTQAGLGTVDLTDPAYNVWLLLHAALDRALEATVSRVIECDEDHCYPLRHMYEDRRRVFLDELADLLAARTPMVIAKHSQWQLGGVNSEASSRGARLPQVAAAWAEVQRLVATLYPNQSARARWSHKSDAERRIAMAHR
jgi:hypothetical protein